jgi:hypothetical protein
MSAVITAWNVLVPGNPTACERQETGDHFDAAIGSIWP